MRNKTGSLNQRAAPTVRQVAAERRPATSTTSLAERVVDAIDLIGSQETDPVLGDSDVLIDQWHRQFAGEDIAAMTLGIRIRRLGMLLDELLAAFSEREGLKLNEVLLLMALRRVGPPYCLRPTDILKMHSVTSGTVTYRIDQLTRQNLAERVADPNDRRGYLIRLTPHGLETADAVLHQQRKALEDFLGPLRRIDGAFQTLEELLRLFEKCMLSGTLEVKPSP